MSGFTTETEVTTTVVTKGTTRVPAPEEGADYETLSAAFTAAWTEYRDKAGVPDGEQIPPGTLKFHPEQGQIVIRWTVEEVA